MAQGSKARPQEIGGGKGGEPASVGIVGGDELLDPFGVFAVQAQTFDHSGGRTPPDGLSPLQPVTGNPDVGEAFRQDVNNRH